MADTHIYIGTLACGCHVAAVVDMQDSKSETAKAVAKMVRNGCVVSRHEIAALHDGSIKLSSCKHGVLNA